LLSQAAEEKFRDKKEPRTLAWTEWETLMLDTSMVDASFTKDDAALCFLWAKTFATDEMRRRQKVVDATFVDFLEALARIATFKWFPTQPVLDVARAADPEFDGSVGSFLANLTSGKWKEPVLEQLAIPTRWGWQERERSSDDLAPEVESVLLLIFERLGGGAKGVSTRVLEDGRENRLVRRRKQAVQGANRAFGAVAKSSFNLLASQPRVDDEE
jgi:hypothetical protein